MEEVFSDEDVTVNWEDCEDHKGKHSKGPYDGGKGHKGGDYDDSKLYETADDTYENISDKVINHMAKNQYIRDELMTKRRWDGTNQTPVVPPAFTPSRLESIL